MCVDFVIIWPRYLEFVNSQLRNATIVHTAMYLSMLPSGPRRLTHAFHPVWSSFDTNLICRCDGTVLMASRPTTSSCQLDVANIEDRCSMEAGGWLISKSDLILGLDRRHRIVYCDGTVSMIRSRDIQQLIIISLKYWTSAFTDAEVCDELCCQASDSFVIITQPFSRCNTVDFAIDNSFIRERSCCGLRRLKTYLRGIMTQQRLNWTASILYMWHKSLSL